MNAFRLKCNLTNVPAKTVALQLHDAGFCHSGWRASLMAAGLKEVVEGLSTTSS